MMQHGDEQFREIKKALVGEEFGKIGGLVKEIADIKTQLASVTAMVKTQIDSQSKKSKWRSRDKALVLMAVIGVLGSIITTVISRL